jgi:peptidoglycan/LPS O-acetylase OafA/YrhL
MQMNFNYRKDIDGLRAIAILSVFIYHGFPNLLPGGFVGVDIFFVISGYLISFAIFDGIDKGNFSFSDFYVRRARRIFPALIASLIAIYIVGLFVLLPGELTRLGKNIASAATFTLNFVLKQNTGYFDAAGEQNAALHLWSLCIEEQFYILFPPLFLLISKIRLNRILVIITIILSSFYLNVVTVEDNATAAFYLPTTRFWEMALGSLLAAILIEYRSKLDNFGLFSSAFGMVLIAVGVFFIDKNMLFPGWFALAPSLGALFVLAASKENICNTALSHPLMVLIGKISFPLYLWHYPIFAYLRVYEGELPTVGARLVAMCLAVLLAWMTYKFIEYPIRFGSIRRVSNKIVIGGLVFLLLAIAVIGKKTQGARGFPSRVNQQIAENLKHPEEKPIGAPCTSFKFNSEELSCSISNPQVEPTHALIGDSHASHFHTGVAEYVNERGGNLILLSGPGCVPFLGVRTRHAKGDPQTCGPIVNEIHSFLDKNPGIKTVVLATRGPISITGKPFGEEDVIGRYIDSDQYPNAKNLDDLFAQSLERTVSHLISAGRKVVLIVDNPELGFNPALCEDLPLMRKKRATCSVERKVVEERNKDYRILMSKIALAHPSLEIVDSFKAFCDSDYCYAKKDGEWLYEDNNHLTRFGSIQLKQFFRFD